MNNKVVLPVLLIAVLISTASCSDRNKKSDAYGTFEATEVIVSSEAMGRVLKFIIEEGQNLMTGDQVGLIDTTDLNLNRNQLMARKKAILSKLVNISTQIKVYEQQKDNLLIDKHRVKKLMKDGAATQKQLDDIEGGVKVVSMQILAIKSQKQGVLDEGHAIDVQIEQIKENIKKCYLVSPENGIVLIKYIEQNEITSFGKPLYKIADLTAMELKVYVSGSQLPNIKIGDEVEVLIDKNEKQNRELSGKISWISSKAEFTPKTIQTKEERVNLVYAVKIRVINDGSLKIGMPGEVNFKR
ncbi:MAG: HlyD family efflux transporter periplasmic adaptor subunit [Bacteroidales bacterium]|nr:HlyD family efflux transporter periplasmic adaptor subunit [Bacteroidales bacterium]